MGQQLQGDTPPVSLNQQPPSQLPLDLTPPPIPSQPKPMGVSELDVSAFPGPLGATGTAGVLAGRRADDGRQEYSLRQRGKDANWLSGLGLRQRLWAQGGRPGGGPHSAVSGPPQIWGTP